jgi:hypothetical protein
LSASAGLRPTGNGELVAPIIEAAVAATLHFLCLAASGTTLGLISEAFGLEELLFTGTEDEASSTIGTLD